MMWGAGATARSRSRGAGEDKQLDLVEDPAQEAAAGARTSLPVAREVHFSRRVQY